MNEINKEVANKWKLYVHDEEKMLETEKNFFEKNSKVIDYRTNNSSIKWPTKYE